MFKIGDRVRIPKTKSVGVPLLHGKLIRRVNLMGLTYLYIVNIRGAVYILNSHDQFINGNCEGSHFLEQDMELYDPTEDYIGGIEDV